MNNSQYNAKQNIYLKTDNSILMSKNNILNHLNNYNYLNSKIKYLRIKYSNMDITNFRNSYSSKYNDLLYDMSKYIPINKLPNLTKINLKHAPSFNEMVEFEIPQYDDYYLNSDIGYYIEYVNDNIIMKEILRLCIEFDYTLEGKITLYSGETITFII